VGYAHYNFPIAAGNTFATVIPDFLPGVIAYVGFRTRKETLPSWLLPIMLAAMCLLCASFPDQRADWILCLALGLSLPSFRQLQNAAAKKLTHVLAKYSYGIYLTHPFGIVIGMYLLKNQPTWVQVGTALLTTAVFSVTAYHLIENPFIRMGTRIAANVERRYGVDQLQTRVLADVPPTS
jgi:peptidoglycan/LPS O-acetylase OafA/YrhL